MNEQQKRHYHARMTIAQLFRSFLNKDNNRAHLMKHLGVKTMPVIIPALGDTLASNIREAANRHFQTGAEHVIVPICLPIHSPNSINLHILIISTHNTNTLKQLNMNELHDNVKMTQVIKTLETRPYQQSYYST